MAQRCAGCGGPMPPRIGRGRPRKMCETCSPTRKRLPRGTSKTTPAPTITALPGQPGVTDATRRELDACGRTDTPLGLAALVLAGRLDSGQESGSSLATLAKQLEATLRAATKGATVAASPLDELRARRDARRA